MASLKALQEWCRIQCEDYPGVEIKNMSSSFRDGMAFCAIIHKHRPDLIDFKSLSKHNVYDNNRLAFDTAESELGIPALLDPEDMVSMKVPDRLSIITYVSQYYNYFTNRSQAIPPSLKWLGGTFQTGPAITRPVPPGNDQVAESKNDTDDQSKCELLSSTCAACQKHVHLVQRHLVDGKLYHRNCFRCTECSSTLIPGSYKVGSEAGSLVCTHHFSSHKYSRPDLSKLTGPVAILGEKISPPESPPATRGQEKTLPQSVATDETPLCPDSDRGSDSPEKDGNREENKEVDNDESRELEDSVKETDGTGATADREEKDRSSESEDSGKERDGTGVTKDREKGKDESRVLEDSVKETDGTGATEDREKEKGGSRETKPTETETEECREVEERRKDKKKDECRAKKERETEKQKHGEEEGSKQEKGQERKNNGNRQDDKVKENDERRHAECRQKEKDGNGEREEEECGERDGSREDEEKLQQSIPSIPTEHSNQQGEKEEAESVSHLEASGRPVPAPRRRFGPSPPRPAPRTRPPKVKDSPTVNDDPNNPGEASRTSPLPTDEPQSTESCSIQSSGTHKPKDPPWMALVHAGPWKKLPPVNPSHVTSLTRSCSAPSPGGWGSKMPVSTNPFETEEETDEESAEEAGPVRSLVSPSALARHPWYGISGAAKAASVISPTQAASKDSPANRLSPTHTASKDSPANRLSPAHTASKDSPANRLSPAHTASKDSPANKLSPAHKSSKDSPTNNVSPTHVASTTSPANRTSPAHKANKDSPANRLSPTQAASACGPSSRTNPTHAASRESPANRLNTTQTASTASPANSGSLKNKKRPAPRAPQSSAIGLPHPSSTLPVSQSHAFPKSISEPAISGHAHSSPNNKPELPAGISHDHSASTNTSTMTTQSTGKDCFNCACSPPPTPLSIPSSPSAPTFLSIPSLLSLRNSPSVPSSLSIPNTSSVSNPPLMPSSQTVPNTSSVSNPSLMPSSQTVPNNSSVSNNPLMANSQSVPNTSPVSHAVSIPSLLSVPNSLSVTNPSSVPNSLSIPNLLSVSNSQLIPSSLLVANTLPVPYYVSVPSLLSVSNSVSIPTSLSVPPSSIPHSVSIPSLLSMPDSSLIHSSLPISNPSSISHYLSIPNLSSIPEAQSISACSSVPSPSSFPNSQSISRSVSIPSLPSVLSAGTEAAVPTSPLPSCQSKRACKKNPFNQKASSSYASPKSTSPEDTHSNRPRAPGHGFPLIKRKVQTDQFIPVEDIQMEMAELERRLDQLELRGVELEKRLRHCQDDEEEETMLVDWFTLIHEKHMLVRREAELVYIAKQQNLEERHADVEYELRCLLNKPEMEWIKDDQVREQQLMIELVTIIEERNNIINSMDQDKQREEVEDKLLAAMIKRKDFHKEPDSTQRKRAGRFRPMKVLKLLSHKTEGGKRKSPHKSKS